MREFVAVAHPIFAFDSSTLKQQALMFRRIGIPTLSSILSATNNDMQDVRRNLEWLIEAGVLFEPTPKPKVKTSSAEYESAVDLLREDSNKLIEVLLGFRIEELIDARGDKEKTAQFLKKIEIDRLESVFYAAVEDPDRLLEYVNSLSANLTRLFKYSTARSGSNRCTFYSAR